MNCSVALSRPFASRRPLRSPCRRPARRVLFINSANIEAAVAVLELETLSRPAYLRALRKLHMQGIARMEEILWRRSAHLCIFKRCRPNCLLARPCAVSTTRSARLLTRRWHAVQRFLNLMHSFGSATSTGASRSRTVCRHACRCSRKLFDYASSWAHPVPLRPHHCAYVGRLLSSWLGVVRP